MDNREKLARLVKEVLVHLPWGEVSSRTHMEIADHLIANGVTVQNPARPLEEWGEDYGDVLWWVSPIEEPPYFGSPLDLDWPGYHTHWTSIEVPEPPKEDESDA